MIFILQYLINSSDEDDKIRLWVYSRDHHPVLLFLPACGSLPDGRLWGEDVTLLSPFSRILSAAERAMLDPRTWAPAGGALIFAIDDWDHKVSKWAVEHHPIFSSRATASDMSGSLRDGLTIWAIVTAIATPGGERAGEWAFSKLKGGAVEVSGFQLSKWTSIIRL